MVARNSAIDGASGGGILPHLNVIIKNGSFWSYRPGVATSEFQTQPFDYAFAEVSPTRLFGGASNGGSSFGIFVRRIATVYGVTFFSYDKPSAQCCLSGNTNEWGYIWDGLFNNFLANGLVGEWAFVFLNDTYRLNVIRSNGRRLLNELTTGQSGPFLPNQSHIIAGARTILGEAGARASYGDSIIYNRITLTNAEWGIWYDHLRVRYNMAKRDGW